MAADPRPVICGMNNPHDQDPRYALYPVPKHSAGGRLYAMLRDAHEYRYPVGGARVLVRREYINSFDRRNVLAAKEWSAPVARAAGARLLPELAGRRVVVLGRQTARALGLPAADWFSRQDGTVASPVANETLWLTAWTVPHPSGMCREYNDPYKRRRLGCLLLDLMEGREPDVWP